jgi:DNA polymerase elongation subunit (family B)
MEEKDIKEFIYDMEGYNNDSYIRPIGRIIEFIDTAKQKKLDKSIFNMLLNFYELY